MRLTKSRNKRIILIAIFMVILIFVLGLFLNSKSPALAWEPPGAYGNPAYSGTQSSMSTYSSLTKYTASDWSFGATDTTELTYDTWRTKYKSPTLKTGSATFVKTAKLADNLYHAMLAGKLKLTVSASAVASSSGAGLVLANARVTHKIKSFICIGNISGTGLARDNFITTDLATGGEDTVTHRAIASQTLSSSASYSGAPSSGQYVRYGISVEQSGAGWSALGIFFGSVAYMHTITFSLTLANNGDTTAPTISGTNNAFTASSAVTISDTGSNLWKYTLNGTTKTYGAKVSSATITLAQGSNSITAYDNLGNSASKTIKYYKPTIKVTSSLSSSGTVTLNGSSTLSQSGKTVGGSHVMKGEADGYYLRYWQKESGVNQGSYYGKSYTYKIPENEA